MAGKSPRAKATVQQFKDEVLGSLLKKLPKEALATGKFKVYQKRPQPNGSSLTSYLDWMEFDPDSDLEAEVASKFIPRYGGGEYVLHLYDAFRNRIEDVPDILLNFPGVPTVVEAQAAAAGMPGPGGDSIQTQLYQEKQRAQLLTIQNQNAFAEAQIAKLTKNGEEKDPMKLAMADLLRSKISGDDQPKATSIEDLIKLKMVVKMFEEDKPASQSSQMEKILETMAAGFGALMTSSMQMQQAQMQSMNGIMQHSMGMLSQVQTMGQQDPIITALTMAPDIIDRLFGGVVNSITQYKEAKIELTAAEAAHGLTRAGQQRPTNPPAGNGAATTPPAGGAPKTNGNGNGSGKTSNDFLKIVYESYKRRIPPPVAADNVQYWLSEEQLHGILSAGPDQVIGVLEANGLKKFFDQDPNLRQYVLLLIIELQKIYTEAADKADAEKKTAKPEPVAP